MRSFCVSLAAAAVVILTSAGSASAATGPCVIGTQAPLCTIWTGKAVFVADGDTVDVDIAGDGTRRPLRIRITGLQAMEMRVYSSIRSRRRGACHAVAATNRLERILRGGRNRVRLAAHVEDSRSGSRTRRSIAVRSGEGWRDVGPAMLSEGHALWLPNGIEWAWNRQYSVLAQQAAAAGRRLWDRDACGTGPSAGADLSVRVNWDADGRDEDNPNGEWIEVRNGGGADVPLGRWWVRDSHLRRYTFPSWAVAPAGGRVRVHVGGGSSSGSEFFWGLPEPAFENATDDERAIGDGAYLFDPQGDLRGWDLYPCRAVC